MALKTRIIIAKRTLEKLYQNTFEPLVHNTTTYQYYTYILFSTPHYILTCLFPLQKKQPQLWIDGCQCIEKTNERRSEQQAFWKFNFRTRVILPFFWSSLAHTPNSHLIPSQAHLYSTAKRTLNKGTALCFIHTYTYVYIIYRTKVC